MSFTEAVLTYGLGVWRYLYGWVLLLAGWWRPAPLRKPAHRRAQPLRLRPVPRPRSSRRCPAADRLPTFRPS